MNLGIKARGVLSHSGNTVETIVPLNHCSFNAGGIRNCAAGRQQNDLGTLDPPPPPPPRIVVRKFELWVPMFRFTIEG